MLEVLLWRLLAGRTKPLLKHVKRYAEFAKSKFCAFMHKAALPAAIIMTVCGASFLCIRLKVVPYVITTSTESPFIEDNYVSPTSEMLTFPETKRNLIYILLESMETTYTSEENGGVFDTDYIPNLTALAKENLNFSNTEKLGGPVSYDGTTWTSAALVSQTSGMIIKVPVFASSDAYSGAAGFAPSLVSIGDLLEEAGYKQTALFGSDANFGGRKAYFEMHGNYKIVDEVSLKAEGRLDKDYRVWWGYEDEKLFSYAKEEILELAASGQPFNFTMLTADTHFPDGYVCRNCKDTHDKQYGNVLSCSDVMVNDFINWIKEQPFYENTTIVVVGDHLTMDSEFLKDTDKDYVRTVYNCFINAANTPVNPYNRNFATFDLFPTTLSALGVEIEGDRLGLGTNLFSDLKTLTEIHGHEALNHELQKKSNFYNQQFLEKESKLPPESY